MAKNKKYIRINYKNIYQLIVVYTLNKISLLQIKIYDWFGASDKN